MALGGFDSRTLPSINTTKEVRRFIMDCTVPHLHMCVAFDEELGLDSAEWRPCPPSLCELGKEVPCVTPTERKGLIGSDFPGLQFGFVSA